MPTRKSTTKSTTTSKTPTKKTPVKRTTATRTRTTQAPPSDLSGIALKRAQTRGEDGPQVDPYAPTVWGSEESSGALVDLDLPSGQKCLAQRPGPEGLMAAGLLDDLDMLATVVPKIMGGKSTAKKFDPSVAMRNKEMLAQAVKLMNRVVVFVVVKPELTEEPDDPRDKERGKIYPSSVSMEDKMFLFNWAVGGTRDLARFRQELQESVADVESGADVEGAAE
jgi:hypothetical protein